MITLDEFKQLYDDDMSPRELKREYNIYIKGLFGNR